MQTRPKENEFATFYEGYISLVPESDILKALRDQITEIAGYANAVGPQEELFRYATGKWSIREVFGHINDAERVFAFRAFSFSRGEKAQLPPFDENAYVAQSGYQERSLANLVEEFTRLRESNLYFLTSLSEEARSRVGIANKNPISVRALAFIMVGHVRHHMMILRERYGLVPPA